MLKSIEIIKHKRLKFGKMEKVVDIPNLMNIQHESYDRFLQMNTLPEDREEIGLQEVFKSIFPIKDFTGSASLEFVSYGFGEIKHTKEECIHKGMTYEIPIKIIARLVVYDLDKETGILTIRNIKEQEIYFGAIPLMTKEATFIVNGPERVVVSQLHRSSGVFFDHDNGETHSSGKLVYNCRVIPVRGSWIEMEIDPGKDLIFIKIDRRRKFPVTLLLKALGYSTEDLLEYFYDFIEVVIKKEGLFILINEKNLKGKRAVQEVVDYNTGEVIVRKGRIFTQKKLNLLEELEIKLIPVKIKHILGKILHKPVISPIDTELIALSNEIIDVILLKKFRSVGIKSFFLLNIDEGTSSETISKTLLADKVEIREDALIEMYRLLKPGNPATLESSQGV